MTRLTRAREPERPTRPALRQGAGKISNSARTRWLTDTPVRLGLGTAVVLVTAVSARQDRVGRREARAFRAVNGLPDSFYGPVWVIMQLGALGAVPAAAIAALLARDRELAGRLLAGGTGSWALSKLVKRIVRRSRPAALVSGARTRGRDASGLGYLSGHAGVAVAMGAAALPRLSRSGRAVVAATVPVVGLSRIYVGAHLPLDVAGGAGLGLAVEAAVALAWHLSGHADQSDVRRRNAAARAAAPRYRSDWCE
jgi:glycosyltransferase 2 family protein